MLKVSATLLFLYAITAIANGQQKPFTKFQDTITIPNKIVFTARAPGTDSNNFVYAVCDDTGPYFDFGPRHCNVTVQEESQKRTCPVYVAPNDLEKESSSELIFYSFGDDKVIIRWANSPAFSFKGTSQMKILEMSTCKLVDVPLPADRIIYVAVYEKVADIGFWDQTYCRSRNCKITINSDGKQIDGPTDILKDVDCAFNDPIGVVNPNSPDQGFYMTVGLKSEFGHGKHNEYFYKIDGQGNSDRIMTFGNANYARESSSHGLFSFCQTLDDQRNTTIACSQYDKSLKLTLNTTIHFEDGKLKRWLQPYNMKEGGLLLVSGKASDVEGKQYDTFSMTKIHRDGQRGEAVEFDRLNFTCPWIKGMKVKMSENEESGEICARFMCTHHDETDKRQKTAILQLAVRCLSRA